MKTELKIENLTVQYPYGAEAVSCLSFIARTGAPTVILADEEGGKTSLLKCIAGLVPAMQGKVTLDGADFLSLKIKERNTCLLYEDDAFFNGKTLHKNLYYPFKIRKISKKDAERTILQAAEKFNITALLNKKVRKLTDKEKTRLAFARVSTRDADVYLFDNPPAEDFLEYIKELSKNKIVIFATDSIRIAEKLNEEVVLLNYGVNLQNGGFDEIKNNPLSVTALKMFNSVPIYEGVISEREGDISLSSNFPEEIPLLRNKLLNDIYINVPVFYTVLDGRIKVYDKRSEQLIYFD